jgi:glycopeptide antibiotics resistance protein
LLGIEPLAFISCIIFLFIYFVRMKNNRVTGGRLIIDAVLLIYLIGLLNITIFPIPFQKTFINDYLVSLGSDAHYKYNLIPFMTIWNAFHNAVTYNTYFLELRNIGGNLILLAPLGVYFHFSMKNLSLRNIIVIGFLVSFLIEIIQLSISLSIGYSYRSFDIDDLLLNTLGFIFGYRAFFLIKNEIIKQGTLASKI